MIRLSSLAAAAAAIAFSSTAVDAAVVAFSNTASITIPAAGTSGPANPFPSTIAVSGLVDPVSGIEVVLNGLSHTFSGDLDVLLVSPDNLTVLLMSDVSGRPVDTTLRFQDGAPAMISASFSGTFSPTNVGFAADAFTGAPAGPYGSTLSSLLAGALNGTWRLYVVDDTGGDIGTLARGWSLEFTTRPETVPAPGVLALFGAGLVGFAAVRRRRG